MYWPLKKVFFLFKAHPLFFSSCLILSCLLAVTQYQFWFGEYSRADLNTLKDEISLVELETDIIRKKNEELFDLDLFAYDGCASCISNFYNSLKALRCAKCPDKENSDDPCYDCDCADEDDKVLDDEFNFKKQCKITNINEH